MVNLNTSYNSFQNKLYSRQAVSFNGHDPQPESKSEIMAKHLVADLSCLSASDPFYSSDTDTYKAKQERAIAAFSLLPPDILKEVYYAFMDDHYSNNH